MPQKPLGPETQKQSKDPDTRQELTSPRSTLQQPNIHLRPRQHHIAHHTPPNEHILDRRQMRVFIQIEDVDIVELDVEVLVDRFQGAADADVIFQLDGDGLVGESFEEAVERERLVSGHVYQVAKGSSDQRTYLKNSMVTPGQLRKRWGVFGVKRLSHCLLGR